MCSHYQSGNEMKFMNAQFKSSMWQVNEFWDYMYISNYNITQLL